MFQFKAMEYSAMEDDADADDDPIIEPGLYLPSLHFDIR